MKLINLNLESTVTSSDFDRVVKWDLLIIGGGPAGLNAALYAKRKGLTCGIISKEIGGQLHNTTDVDNYLGYKLIEGKDLSHQFVNHVNSLEVPIYKDVNVLSIEVMNPDFKISLDDGKVLYSKTLLMATGGMPKKLAVPGEEFYANKGVSYCTTCDAPFFKDKHVIVAGGGNSAAEAILDLSHWAQHITVVHRSQWRADKILLDKIYALNNVTVHLETQLLEVFGEAQMTGVKVFDKTTKQEKTIAAQGLFIEIGNLPKSHLVRDLVQTNPQGEIIVDENQMTSVPGLYAAGDVTQQVFKQIVISAADGAKAALAATQYLNQTYKENSNGEII